MPRSVVIYINRETFSELRDLLQTALGGRKPAPYTLSFLQGAQSGLCRVRVTELSGNAVTPLIARLAEGGKVTLAAASDRDVRAATYGELAEGADRFNRLVTLQFSSPTMLDLDGQQTPFPLIPLMFKDYARIWNSFSKPGMIDEMEWVQHVNLIDFKISPAATRFGLAFEGWVRLEMDRGRTEEEIARFNALADFAFYAGTGLHMVDGLGQTRRTETKR